MSENSSDTLELLTVCPSAHEAGFVRHLLAEAGIEACVGGESTQTTLSYVGTAIGGCRVFVFKKDLEAAAKVLGENDSSGEEDLLARGAAEGWWEEEEGDAAEPDSSRGENRDSPSPELLRAYYAAIIGLLLFPFAVQLYSLYLIVRHRLFLPDRGGNNWRFRAAMIANTVGLCMTKIYWSYML